MLGKELTNFFLRDVVQYCCNTVFLLEAEGLLKLVGRSIALRLLSKPFQESQKTMAWDNNINKKLRKIFVRKMIFCFFSRLFYLGGRRFLPCSR